MAVKTKQPIIKRYFDNVNLKKIEKDFSFLLKQVKDLSNGLEFSIRDNSFNIYYMGNSLSRISFEKNGMYKIEISRKFFDGTPAINPKFHTSYSIDKKKVRYKIILSKKQLHPFFQKKHMTVFKRKIKEAQFQEETTFEQSLIADNSNREDIIFIDRQVTDKKWRKKLDLLALKQLQDNKYYFVVCEVKLGNNPELKDKVYEQLKGYVDHIDKHFDDYKMCYEENYRQKKKLGLLDEPKYASIEIVKPVEGLVVVGGYSGAGEPQIKLLKEKYPKLKIETFFYKLKLKDF